MKMNIRRFFLTLLSLPLLSVGFTSAQIPGKGGFRLIQNGGSPEAVERLLSNSVIDMVPGDINDDIYMGTGGGVSVWHLNSADSSWGWQSFSEKHGLGEGSVSALDVKDGIIWAATAYTQATSVGNLPAGGGVGYSTDFGYTWTWFDQPVDPSEGYDTTLIASPTTTNVQNVTYDLLITSEAVWIASWGGGIRRYGFSDSSWQVVTPDDDLFSALDHLNHLGFSLAGDDSVLWVGTAAGINKSTDGGETWENFNHANSGISGNFVTALGRQVWQDKDVLWAATWQAEGADEYYGISKTENGGITWEVVLTLDNATLKTHNFAFDDSIVYAATDAGLYKSVDFGETWELFPQIVDQESGERLYDPEVYCALAHLGTLWVGTGDGVASSDDYGNSWTLHRSYLPTGEGGQPATYAYPNPFSPRLNYVIRFQYDMPRSGAVTVKIFDFAMDEVATVVEDKPREAGDWYEVWTGKRSNGEEVASGVYFYRVERSGCGPIWGKFAVIY
jgi:hypothetical protein